VTRHSLRNRAEIAMFRRKCSNCLEAHPFGVRFQTSF
jgi:hypothetical protein